MAVRAIRLPDGRRIAYAEYGDAAGLPLLHAHGGFSSRLDARAFDQAGRDLGVRVIAPDRPGVGGSELQPGRTLLDWPADAEALADALGLGRFAVSGWSAGGPYALATALALADRVTSVALIASGIPIDTPGSRSDLDRPDRFLLVLAEHAPWAMSGLLCAVRIVPAALLRAGARAGAGRADAAILEAGDAGTAMAYIREAIRPGPHGVIRDYVVFGAPWGFGLGEVRTPVTIWQGDADILVPPRYADVLAAGLPSATLMRVPGEGHLSLAVNRARDILESVL